MKMTYKRQLTMELDEMYGVFYHFEKNNHSVCEQLSVIQ